MIVVLHIIQDTIIVLIGPVRPVAKRKRSTIPGVIRRGTLCIELSIYVDLLQG